MKYCNNCQRWIEPIKRFNWAVFLLGLFLTLGIVSWGYVIYYFFMGGRCPICNSQNWGIPSAKGESGKGRLSTVWMCPNERCEDTSELKEGDICPRCGSAAEDIPILKSIELVNRKVAKRWNKILILGGLILILVFLLLAST